MSKEKLTSLQQNPLIDRGETASRCASVINYVQETLTISNTLSHDNDTNGLSRDAVTGLYFILETVGQALNYESQKGGRDNG